MIVFKTLLYKEKTEKALVGKRKENNKLVKRQEKGLNGTRKHQMKEIPKEEELLIFILIGVKISHRL